MCPPGAPITTFQAVGGALAASGCWRLAVQRSRSFHLKVEATESWVCSPVASTEVSVASTGVSVASTGVSVASAFRRKLRDLHAASSE